MLKRFKNWWNRKSLAAEAFKKRQLLVVERAKKFAMQRIHTAHLRDLDADNAETNF